MNSLIFVQLGILSGCIAFLTNWLALIPWRRAKKLPWSERARLHHPVLVAAASNFLTVPAVFALAGTVIWPDIFPHWLLIAIVSAIGTAIGTFPMDREVFPRINLRDLLRQSAIGLLIGYASWFVFLTSASLMPRQFNYDVMVISGVVALVWGGWTLGLWRVFGQFTGWLQPAPERLRNIVNNVSAKTKIPFRQVWLIRISVAQAFALPRSRILLFSERMLELLSDDEISAICAHELGHLLESFADRCKRSIRKLAFLPWLYFKPIIYTYGHLGVFALLGVTILVPYVYLGISRGLEKRADLVAKSSELDVGTYARALLRLHEDNLIPVVLRRGQASHPHLYDRLLAAGVTPDFARPAAARSMAWHGIVFAGLLGVLIAALTDHLIHAF
jgi:Zn-dependent protease with chaperone function